MKITNILRYYLTPGKQVIQLSPVRTGSTLIYNILRESFPGKVIDKAHTYSRHYKHLPIVATVRNPLDCVASILLSKEKPINDANLRWAVDELTQQGGSDITELSNHQSCLFLRYEDFVSNYEAVFDAFERFFEATIPADRRAIITANNNLDRAMAIASSQRNFTNWDEVTKIHGKHISVFQGRPLYHQEVFTQPQLDLLRPLCANLAATFGYAEESAKDDHPA